MDERKHFLQFAQHRAFLELEDFSRRAFKIFLENEIEWKRNGINYIPSVKEIIDELYDLIMQLNEKDRKRVENENFVVELSEFYNKQGEINGLGIDINLVLLTASSNTFLEGEDNDQTD